MDDGAAALTTTVVAPECTCSCFAVHWALYSKGARSLVLELHHTSEGRFHAVVQQNTSHNHKPAPQRLELSQHTDVYAEQFVASFEQQQVTAGYTLVRNTPLTLVGKAASTRGDAPLLAIPEDATCEGVTGELTPIFSHDLGDADLAPDHSTAVPFSQALRREMPVLHHAQPSAPASSASGMLASSLPMSFDDWSTYTHTTDDMAYFTPETPRGTLTRGAISGVGDGYTDSKELAFSPDSVEDDEEGYDTDDSDSKGSAEKLRKSETDIHTVAKHFHQPIKQAATILGICPTVLKKICRRNNIKRWPSRRLRSIEKQIRELEEARNSSDSEPAALRKMQKQLVQLKAERDSICFWGGDRVGTPPLAFERSTMLVSH